MRALPDRQRRREHRLERVELRFVVAHVVVAGRVRVRHQPRRTGRQRHLLGRRVEERAARTALPLQAHRQLPGLRRRLIGAVEEALLRQRHLARAAFAAQLGRHDRHARLLDERSHHVGRRRAQRRAQRRHELVGIGVAPRVRRQIAADRAHELVVSDPVLDHRQHRRALGVGDAVVERVLDRVLALDGQADLLHRRLPVGVHRIGRVVARERELPRRLERVGDFAIGPLAERLVEPRVVPPAAASRSRRTSSAPARARAMLAYCCLRDAAPLRPA